MENFQIFYRKFNYFDNILLVCTYNVRCTYTNNTFIVKKKKIKNIDDQPQKL